MYRLTILYPPPADPAEFARYYDEVHLPIARRMRGLTRWTITRLEAAPDGTEPLYGWVVDLCAESRSDLEVVLASDEGRAASADVPNFAPAGVRYLWGPEEEVAVR